MPKQSLSGWRADLVLATYYPPGGALCSIQDMGQP